MRFSSGGSGDALCMRNHKDGTQATSIKVTDLRPEARVRGHRGSKPRGNPPLDRPELRRGMEKLSRVLGS